MCTKAARHNLIVRNAVSGRHRSCCVLGVFVGSLVLVGCAQNGGIGGMGQKESVGTGLGVAAGAVAGAFFGKGSGKAVAMLTGAAVGGLIGNRLGSMLDEQDKKALLAREQQALLSQADDAPINWSSTRSGATATITPGNSRTETRPMKIVRDANVAPAPQLDLIGTKYIAKSTTNVRLAPSSDADISTTIKGGGAIWAVGKVHDQPWIMVARNGKSIGYVTAANVAPTPRAQTVSIAPVPATTPIQTASANPTQAPIPAAPVAPAFDLDATAPVRSPTDLDALGSTEKVDVVTASVSCRDIKTTVMTNGQTMSGAQTACRSPDGAWQLD